MKYRVRKNAKIVHDCEHAIDPRVYVCKVE